jgi:hypothetical protein
VTKAYDDIRAAGFAQNPVNVVIEYPQGSRFSDERNFRPVLEFEQQLQQLPQIIKVISANEMLREIDKAFNTKQTSDVQFSRYSAAQIDQLLFLAELSGNDDLDDLLLKDKTKTQMLALTRYMSSKELDRFRAQVTALATRYLPRDIEVYITGTTVLWANMDEQVSYTQLYSLGWGSVFLLVLLIASFRSFRLVIVASLVNALPLAITLGMMGFLDIKINMATALIGGITLGVVVDDTIHLFTRIKYFLNQGLDMVQSIEKAIAHAGKSIVNTTLIIAGGFACLASSSFLPSAQFGVFVTIAISIAMFLDLYLGPLLLKILYRTEPVNEAAAVDELLKAQTASAERSS